MGNMFSSLQGKTLTLFGGIAQVIPPDHVCDMQCRPTAQANAWSRAGLLVIQSGLANIRHCCRPSTVIDHASDCLFPCIRLL